MHDIKTGQKLGIEQCWSADNTLGKSISPGGELSVALTRHRVTCGSKSEIGGIFFSCFGPFLFTLFVLRF